MKMAVAQICSDRTVICVRVAADLPSEVVLHKNLCNENGKPET
jgi:hypothetical protein